MKKSVQRIWNSHLNKNTDLPKKAFETFEETLGYINIHSLTGVCPYQCPVCGKYHYGHPNKKEKSQVEELLRLLQAHLKREKAKDEELATLRKLYHIHEMSEEEKRAWKKEKQSLQRERKRYSEIFSMDPKILLDTIQNRYPRLVDDHTELQKKHKKLQHLLREHFSDLESFIYQDLGELRKLVPKISGEYVLKEVKKQTGYHLEYVKGKEVKLSTSSYSTLVEAYQEMYDLWKQLKEGTV